MHSLAPITAHLHPSLLSHAHIYILSLSASLLYPRTIHTATGWWWEGVVHYRHGTNENDHDLRSLRLSAAARSIVGVKTNFRDRNRGGQNRRSSERRDSIAMPLRGSREPDAQIRCLAARHACYGPACYGSAETSLTGILCHPVGAIPTTPWIAEGETCALHPRHIRLLPSLNLPNQVVRRSHSWVIQELDRISHIELAPKGLRPNYAGVTAAVQYRWRG